MQRKIILSLTLLLITWMSLIISSPVVSTSIVTINNKTTTSDNTSTLTIYTYDSLMADPYYDIAGNFSAYSGLSKDNINIQRFSDANELVSKLVSEKGNPQADIVIGIDNALRYLFNLSDVLVPYTNTSVLSNIDPNLIQNLDVDNYLVPYDFGIISLYYSSSLVNATSYPVLNNLTLDSLLNSPLLSKIVSENPTISSTGLGFLLWTIAYYGDPNGNVSGLSGKDWHNFWNDGGKTMNYTASWGDAFTVFADPTADKPVMVSYTTSPAYDACIYNDNSTSASVSSYHNDLYGWYQIEGLGMVKKDTPNPYANKFMDWFLSTSTQNQIPESQWMYPSNTQAQIPLCFSQASLKPANVTMLNNFLTPSHLQSYLSYWINEWQQFVVTQSLPGFDLFTFIAPFLTVIVLIRRKNKFK